MYRCQNLDCTYLEYFDVDRPDTLFMNCPKLNELTLLWHDVIMTRFLNITHQLLYPLQNLSYLKLTDMNANTDNTPQCSPVTCLSNCTTCDVIEEAYDIYNKSCTVEMKCIDGTKTRSSYDTKKLINSSMEQCKKIQLIQNSIKKQKIQQDTIGEHEDTIDEYEKYLVITGKSISMASIMLIMIISHCFVINIDTT